MSIKSTLTLLCLTILLSACCDNPEPPLKGCCDTPAINTTVGNATLYVANIFTPNGDGLNDHLFPLGDLFLVRIISFQISDKEGQLVFQALDLTPNISHLGWDGKTVNGVIKEGLYNVTVQAEASDGTISTVEGKVCNFPCMDMSGGETISIQGCQFPTQVTDGQYNPNVHSGEGGDCFK